jgi:hypothetical protein
MNNLKPNVVGDESITTEIKNELTENGCESITKLRTNEKVELGKKYNHLTVIRKCSSYERPAGRTDIYYECKCDCGKLVNVSASNLKFNHNKSCGCLKHKLKRHITQGMRFGKLVVIKRTFDLTPNIKHRTKFLCVCDCGKETEVIAYNLLRGKTKSCGCGIILNKRYKGFVGTISVAMFNHLKKQAEKRLLCFDITEKYLGDLLTKQNGRCALSGLEISMGNGTKCSGRTASVDRINNELGYVKNNVWWVHKDINIMKLSHELDYFIQLCHYISNYNK